MFLGVMELSVKTKLKFRHNWFANVVSDLKKNVLLAVGRLPRICTAVCCYNLFSEMHRIEGLNNFCNGFQWKTIKKYLIMLKKKKNFTPFERILR